MYAYLKRLLTTTAAYQAADIASKFIALGLLPVYTRHISRAGYGVAELLGTLVIFVSILVRLGIGEAFVRYYYADQDAASRDALIRRAVGFLVLATTAAAAVLCALAGPLSVLVLDHRDATTFAIAVLGLWAFTNLELAYALLRVDERARTFVTASLVNVAITIALTVVLVVGLGQGARGLLLGNYAGSAVVLLGLWFSLRRRLIGPMRGGESLRRMLAFGLPTVPADASVFALNLADRYYLYHRQSAAVAGLYSLAVKLAGVIVFTVRAFQYAWPPLAYSVRSDDEARRLYALVTTYYVLVTGWVVVGLALLGRWLVRLLAAPQFFGAHEALPWLALGWALYGLYVVLVVIAGRAGVTTRNFPAALAGLVANLVLLVVLAPAWGIAGAGVALCGAYVVMLGVMHAFTRRLFSVPFEWGRLTLAVGLMSAVAVGGELALPSAGAGGLLARVALLLAVPLLLGGARFYRVEELARLRSLLARARPASG